MKILLTALFCLMLTLPAFADQQTTVLQERAVLGRAQGVLPYIDGSNNPALEKQANALIRSAAQELARKLGGGEITYTVTLNRPSLVSLLLEGRKGGAAAWRGLNLDLTTGREFAVADFFVDSEAVRTELGEYAGVLFGERGLYLCGSDYDAYDSFVSYDRLLAGMRIGEAGRIMQVARLTAAADGKTLLLPRGGLLALKLDANPSTGYSWALTAAGGEVQKVGSSFTIPRTEEARTGTPGTEIIFLAVQKPGAHTVKLEYKRPWERLSLQSITFKVIVEA